MAVLSCTITEAAERCGNLATCRCEICDAALCGAHQRRAPLTGSVCEACLEDPRHALLCVECGDSAAKRCSTCKQAKCHSHLATTKAYGVSGERNILGFHDHPRQSFCISADICQACTAHDEAVDFALREDARRPAGWRAADVDELAALLSNPHSDTELLGACWSDLAARSRLPAPTHDLVRYEISGKQGHPTLSARESMCAWIVEDGGFHSEGHVDNNTSRSCRHTIWIDETGKVWEQIQERIQGPGAFRSIRHFPPDSQSFGSVDATPDGRLRVSAIVIAVPTGEQVRMKDARRFDRFGTASVENGHLVDQPKDHDRTIGAANYRLLLHEAATR